jgi:hypothetical protein
VAAVNKSVTTAYKDRGGTECSLSDLGEVNKPDESDTTVRQ